MTEESLSIEQRATQMGWRPQEEFRGNPDNFVSAEKFVEMAETSLPHLKGTLRVMEKTMSEQSRTINELRNDVMDMVGSIKSAEQKAYDRAVKDLQAKQNAAKEAGDMPAFVEATEQLQAKIDDHPALTGKPAAGHANPETETEKYQKWLAAEPRAFEDWKAKPENNWFTENPEMFSYAQQMDQFLQTKHGFDIGRKERLEKMSELVRAKFPEAFGDKPVASRKAGSPVEGGDVAPSRGGNGQSFNDMPKEAQDLCIKWTGKDGKGETGTMKGLTREQYVKDFFRERPSR